MKKLSLVSLVMIVLFLAASTALAAVRIDQISNIGDIQDYVVGPGKQYLYLDPGQSVTKEIHVTNRFPQDRNFHINLEDIKGSNGESNIEFMGLLAGPYSLKDYLHPEVTDFQLKPGDRMTIPVTISIPKDAVPGGLYGAVIVTMQNERPPEEVPPSQITGALPVRSRIAVLYFVRVNGPVKEDGLLKDFKSSKKIYWSTNKPVTFSYSFANTGNVYLNPAGDLEIKNLYGTRVDDLKIDASYVLPSSTRNNTISWKKDFSMGRYSAKLTLNRGYLGSPDQTDVKTVTFWVIPWEYVVIFLICLFLVIAIIRGSKKWFRKNFERRKK